MSISLSRRQFLATAAGGLIVVQSSSRAQISPKLPLRVDPIRLVIAEGFSAKLELSHAGAVFFRQTFRPGATTLPDLNTVIQVDMQSIITFRFSWWAGDAERSAATRESALEIGRRASLTATAQKDYKNRNVFKATFGIFGSGAGWAVSVLSNE